MTALTRIGPDGTGHTHRTSRLTRRCGMCGHPIHVGDRYVEVVGVWLRMAACLTCAARYGRTEQPEASTPGGA